MANGRFTLGKQSGGTLGLVFPDGVSNTEVVLPESGELATKEYVDTGAGVAFVANDTRVKTALNAGGNAPIYACRAWVNFNGTGAVAIRASGNASSVADRGVGKYTVNFITAYEDNDYAVVVGNDLGDDANYNNYGLQIRSEAAMKTTSVDVSSYNGSAGWYDHAVCILNIVR